MKKLGIPAFAVAPCKDCKKRCANCHSKCKKYKDYVKLNAKNKAEFKREQESNYTRAYKKTDKWGFKSF